MLFLNITLIWVVLCRIDKLAILSLWWDIMLEHCKLRLISSANHMIEYLDGLTRLDLLNHNSQHTTIPLALASLPQTCTQLAPSNWNQASGVCATANHLLQVKHHHAWNISCSASKLSLHIKQSKSTPNTTLRDKRIKKKKKWTRVWIEICLWP